MINNYLNDIGKYEKFNFGLITSISTFDEYYKHLENLKNKKGKKDNIENTSYYLMKNHCKKYKYELLVYDLFNNKFYIENDSNNQLIEYNNFYEFNFEYKLNIPKLDSIFSLKPKKKSIKYVNKDNFISELNKTKLFKIDNDNKDSLNILGNFEYNQKFLDIKEIEEDNFYLRISENNKEKKKNINIFKYKNKSIVSEIFGEYAKNDLNSINNIKFKKRDTQIILFSLNKNIKLIGNKKERNSNEENI